MKSDLDRWLWAFGVLAAFAVLLLWSDAVMAQSEGQEIISGFGEWIIYLARRGAIIMLFFALVGAVAALSGGNVVVAGWALFGAAVAGAIFWGAEAAVTRIFTL